MSFRDDRDALLQRIHALEQRARRCAALERRIRDLKRDNERLRAAAPPSAATTQGSASGSPSDGPTPYVDAKITDYARAIIAAVRQLPAVLSGPHPGVTNQLIVAAQRCDAAIDRGYLVPEDVRRAAVELVGPEIILTAEAFDGGGDVGNIVQAAIDAAPVP